MRKLVLIALLFVSLGASAQVLTEAREFTRQDTLRGTLGACLLYTSDAADE